MHHSPRFPGAGRRGRWHTSRRAKVAVLAGLLLAGILLGWVAFNLFLAALV